MYLVRVKPKAVTDFITTMNVYREFVTIRELTAYLFENAGFIEAYDIFQIRPLEENPLAHRSTNQRCF